MNATPDTSIAAQQQLDLVFTQLAEHLQQRVAGITCRIHHGSNDYFAWWAVARYSNSAGEPKIVDVSVECRSIGTPLVIHADLAREDGTVLKEFPGDHASPVLVNGANGLSLEAALQGVGSFLLQQVDCLSAELASGQ